MKIGIDARFYGVVSQGLGRYCEQLVTQVTALDPHNEYVIFVTAGHRFDIASARVTIVECNYRWYGFAEQFRWPFFLMKYRLDLMHFTSFNVPVLYRRRFVVTIHDLILIHFKSAHASTLHPLYFAAKRLLYRWILSSAIHRADRILAVSNFTADDIRTTLNSKKKIDVAYLGYELTTQPKHDDNSTRPMQHQPYFLYVGNAYPHKNLDFLISAFDQWRQSHSQYQLVLVGKHDYFYQRLKAGHMDVEWMHLPGYVTDQELAHLYQNAEAYIFPSLYEGFGIPPLEAMQFGTPVLASNASCLPEILGDAALYFDPNDAASLHKALDQLISDDRLRADLSSLGLEQVKKYSWRRMGEQVIQLYAELEKQYTSKDKKYTHAQS